VARYRLAGQFRQPAIPIRQRGQAIPLSKSPIPKDEVTGECVGSNGVFEVSFRQGFCQEETDLIVLICRQPGRHSRSDKF
jgi:hypothetical protein